MSGDRLSGAFGALVRAEFPRATYQGLWQYQIVESRVDGATGLVLVTGLPVGKHAPADEPDEGEGVKLPPLVDVPFRPPIPGLVVEPAPGSLMLVGFYNGGDPTCPYVAAFDGTAPMSVRISAPLVQVGGDAARPLAFADVLSTWAAQVVAKCAAADSPIVIPPLDASVATQKATGE